MRRKYYYRNSFGSAPDDTETSAEDAGGDTVLCGGDLLLLPPGTTYMLYGGGAYSLYRVCFSGDPGFALPQRFRLREPVRILQTVQNLLYYMHSTAYPPAMGDHALYLLLGEIRMQVLSGQEKGTPLCERVRQWVHENAERNITVKEAAKQFDYNPLYLSGLFRQSGNGGLKEYIVSERVNCAKYLLLTTDLPLKEIAQRMQFSDYKQFLKFFTYHE